ncbi:MAG: glycosyltransferase family 9 protein [Actinomycetota bacterium]|nr:glycosyltransferase family 9 protein [Actinomycetota bacterium]
MRLLVYRALGLGDFLTAVPAYRALARAFPAAEVFLAAPEPLRPLAALTGAVDTFLPTAELAPPPWRGPAPELAVNLHGRGPQSHRVLQGLEPQQLVAFERQDLDVSGPRWRAQEHEVARWCRLLTESGMPADPAELDLAPPEDAPPVQAATVVHVGAAGAARRWPVDRFAAVARALEDSGHHVVLTGVDAERPLALAAVDSAGLPADRVLAGRLGLGPMAALVAAARLVVCGDTGVAHLATAYGIPSVLLFGAMSPAQWGPPPTRRQHRVLWHPEHATAPSPAEAPHPALLAIGVQEVLGAVQSLERDLLTPPRSR